MIFIEDSVGTLYLHPDVLGINPGVVVLQQVPVSFPRWNGCGGIFEFSCARSVRTHRGLEEFDSNFLTRVIRM